MEFERRRRAGKSIDLVPLINIVFLLLIFFMLTSTLVVPDAFEVTPPESDRGRPGAADPAVVLISGEGALAFDNEPVALSQLEGRIAAARAARPGAPLLIKADGTATAGDVAAVLRRARAAGADKVGLAATVAQ